VDGRRGSGTRQSIRGRRAPTEDEDEGEDGRRRCSSRKSIGRGMAQKPGRDGSGGRGGDGRAGPLARRAARSPGGAVRSSRGPAAAPESHLAPPVDPLVGGVIDQWDFTRADGS
jgi:hypothetical protein